MQPPATCLQQVLGQYPFRHTLSIDQQDCMEVLSASTAHDFFCNAWLYDNSLSIDTASFVRKIGTQTLGMTSWALFL